MTVDRIRMDVWISAHLRQCFADGIAAYVIRKGDPQSGTLLLKINRLGGGCSVLGQSRDLDGNLGWLPAFADEAVGEAQADAYIDRALQRDPDLWVVEIEDREGRHPFPGPVFRVDRR